MKKLFKSTAALLSIVIMTSCSAPGKNSMESQNGLNSSFKANVAITLDEMNSDGTVSRYGTGMWDVEFASPNTISGVTLSFTDGNVEASYKGLSFSVPQSAMPIKSRMSNLITAADELAKSEKLEGNEKDGNIEISGKLDGGDYILTVDKSGNILKFEMPNNKLSMNFSDIAPITGKESDTPEETTETASEAVQETTSAEAETTSAEQ